MTFFKPMSRKYEEDIAAVKEAEVDREMSVGMRRTHGLSVSRSGRYKPKTGQRKTILNTYDSEKRETSKRSDQMPRQDAANQCLAKQTTASDYATATSSSEGNKSSAQQTTTSPVTTTSSSAANKSSAQETTANVHLTTTSSKSISPEGANRSSAQQATANDYVTATSSKSVPSAEQETIANGQVTTSSSSSVSNSATKSGARAPVTMKELVVPSNAKTSGYSTAL